MSNLDVSPPEDPVAYGFTSSLRLGFRFPDSALRLPEDASEANLSDDKVRHVLANAWLGFQRYITLKPSAVWRMQVIVLCIQQATQEAYVLEALNDHDRKGFRLQLYDSNLFHPVLFLCTPPGDRGNPQHVRREDRLFAEAAPVLDEHLRLPPCRFWLQELPPLTR